MLLCNWRRKRQARQRLKRRAEKKKQRMIKKRKKEVKAMKGLMVTKGLQQEGVTYQEMMTLMDEGLEGRKKGATKRQQKALGMCSIYTYSTYVCTYVSGTLPLFLASPSSL